jgi:hypothetical protein
LAPLLLRYNTSSAAGARDIGAFARSAGGATGCRFVSPRPGRDRCFLCYRRAAAVGCGQAFFLIDGRNRVTPEQSRNLKVGQRVSWLGNDQDRGIIVERDWSGVKIKWDNGKTTFYHHNDMRDIASAPLKI